MVAPGLQVPSYSVRLVQCLEDDEGSDLILTGVITFFDRHD